MKTTIRPLRILEAFKDSFVFVELALLDRYIDTHNILPDDAPGTDVQMAEREV